MEHTVDDECTILIVAATCLITEYYQSYFCKELCLTSTFTGDKWIRDLLGGHPTRFHNMFRMSQQIFNDLLHELETFHNFHGSARTTAREVLGITLYIMSHNESMRVTSERFQHSTETVSRYFSIGLKSLVSLSSKIIKPIDPTFLNTPVEISTDYRYMPYFKVHESHRLNIDV